MSASTSHTESDPSRRADPTHRAGDVDLGSLLSRGAIAGLTGGLVFILANMWFATAHGKPAVAPFLSVSTIFRFSDQPMTSGSLPQEVVIGLVTHLTLSIAFGMVFALVVAGAVSRLGARATGAALLAPMAVVYGLLLYVVDFQVLGRLFFLWFVNPKGPNQLFELWIHPVAFGLVLIPFFLVLSSRSRA